MVSLRDLQLNLETTWLNTSADSFRAHLSESPFSSTSIGSYLLGKCAKDMELAVTNYVHTVTFKTLAQKAVWLMLSPLEITTLTLRCLLDVSFSQHPGFNDRHTASNCMSSISIKLGKALVQHFNYLVFRAKNPRGYDFMEDFLKNKPRSYRYRTIRWWKTVVEHTDFDCPTSDLASLGYPMLKLAVENTGLFEVMPRILGKRTVYALYPSREVFESIMDKVDTIAYMHPAHLPMVCPPEPWTGVNTGGYLTLGDTVITHYPRTAQKLYDEGHLSVRFRTLNRLGAVPWVINKSLISIMEEAYKTNHPITPLTDIGIHIPDKPWTTSEEYLWLAKEKPEVIQKWKQDTAVIYAEFFQNKVVGQRLAFLRTISIAKTYQNYENIWFPYRMDYRGRFYPLSTTLNPQGDDLAKALLLFSQRTPLSPGDVEAWRWYLIHGANLMGVDKVPFDGRMAFIRQNHGDIIHSARSPLTCEWWTKADKPWSMLAWCREYAAIVTEGQRFTQIPVALDGRCNGLQHLSATVRDEVTGALVSLTPSDTPSDIYTQVLNAVELALPSDSIWKGKVTRALVKRNTMTTPYNVTINGMGQQIQEIMLKDKTDSKLSKDDMLAAVELRTYNHTCIMGLLGKTAELMQWYNKVAKLYMKLGLTISWELPDGFKVLQDIPQMATKKVRLVNKTVHVNYREPLTTQNNRRNTSAFSPNMTHSMDATHMSMFINELPEGVPFATIHDSYGLPAGLVPTCGQLIIKTFCDLYESFDIIEAIQADFRSKTNGDHTLPEPPQRGSLDLAEVRKSIYAFA